MDSQAPFAPTDRENCSLYAKSDARLDDTSKRIWAAFDRRHHAIYKLNLKRYRLKLKQEKLNKEFATLSKLEGNREAKEKRCVHNFILPTMRLGMGGTECKLCIKCGAYEPMKEEEEDLTDDE